MTSAQRLKQRSELMEQEAEAASQVAFAKDAYAPFAAAFRVADEALAALHQERARGNTVDKPTMLAAYDRRMWAGVARNPTRTKLEELTRWHKNILRELNVINAAIERDHRVSRVPKPPSGSGQPSLL